MTRGETQRDFWLLWGGSTISNLGDGIRFTALPLLTVSLTTDPLAVGAVSAASFLPWLSLSLLGGAIADRADRRRLILGGQIVRCAAVGVFAGLVLAGRFNLALIYLIAVVIGTGEVVVDSALQAAVPRVAGDDLDKANSRFASAQFVAGEIVGGPLGAVLFTVSASLPFVVDAVTFGAGATLIALITRPLQETSNLDAETSSVIDDIREGARFLLDQPVLRGITVAVALSNLAGSAVSALLVLLVTDILDSSEVAFGLVIAAGAIGGLVGSLTSPRVVRLFGRRNALVGPFVVLTAAYIGIGVAPNQAVVGIGLFAAMFSGALFNVSGQSIRQRLTPNRLLGRLIATMRFVSMGAIPLGAIGGGLVARAIGVRETMLVGAAISAIATLALMAATAGHDLDQPANT